MFNVVDPGKTAQVESSLPVTRTRAIALRTGVTILVIAIATMGVRGVITAKGPTPQLDDAVRSSDAVLRHEAERLIAEDATPRPDSSGTTASIAPRADPELQAALDQIGVKDRFSKQGSAEFLIDNSDTLSLVFNRGGNAGPYEGLCTISGKSGYRVIHLFDDWYEIRAVKC